MYTWADGRQYHGMWKEGAQHGEGMYMLQNGMTRKGEWNNGQRIKWLSAPVQASDLLERIQDF